VVEVGHFHRTTSVDPALDSLGQRRKEMESSLAMLLENE